MAEWRTNPVTGKKEYVLDPKISAGGKFWVRVAQGDYRLLECTKVIETLNDHDYYFAIGGYEKQYWPFEFFATREERDKDIEEWIATLEKSNKRSLEEIVKNNKIIDTLKERLSEKDEEPAEEESLEEETSEE